MEATGRNSDLLGGKEDMPRPERLFHIHATTAHFPVALIPVALLFYLLDQAGYHEAFAFCSKACLATALATLPLTALSGVLSWRLARKNTSSGIFETKLLTGGLLFVTGILTLGPEASREELRPGYATGLIICLFLVLVLAHLGGQIVHGRIGLPPRGPQDRKGAPDE